jgi:hypothetical protein
MTISNRITPVTIALRIPGTWGHPRELVQSMPEGYRLTGEAMILPDGSSVDFGAAKPDTQFARIFRDSCRNEPTAKELATVDNYQVNVFLSGPGGSLKSAHRMMKAASALVQAGAGGVFIDNCAMAHGGEQWLEMTEDGSPDALTFAFASIIRGKLDIYTMGMQVLGFRDIVMSREDVEKGGFDIVEVIRYVAASEKPIDNQHIIADLDGPRFKVVTEESGDDVKDSPMHNPYGRMKLVSLRDIAERN